MCSDDDDGDIESSAGKDIRSWSDADVFWVTDELAQRIQAAAATAALDADRESSSVSTDVPAHPPLTHTVPFVCCKVCKQILRSFYAFVDDFLPKAFCIWGVRV